MRLPLRLVRAFCLALLPALAGPALVGCGDPSPTPDGAAGGAGASAPASANEPGAAALLKRLRERAATGTAMADAAWNQDVAQLQRLLWPGMAAADAERGSRTHVSLSHVAGSVGAWLARDEAARALEAEPDAISREIHQAWLAATAGPPDDYRDWCLGRGAALLQRLEDDRRARLFARPGR